MHNRFKDQTNPDQQDRVAEEPEIEISPEPLTSIEDQHSISDTPVCQVQPLLGIHTQKIYSYGIETDQRTLQMSLVQPHLKGT